jgi:predicted DNA-binding transcriptional regulator AlpA
MKFYSMDEVCGLYGVSRTTITRWEKENSFPVRVRLGTVSDDPTARPNGRIGFPVKEVDAWAQARMDARTSPKKGNQSSDEKN